MWVPGSIAGGLLGSGVSAVASGIATIFMIAIYIMVGIIIFLVILVTAGLYNQYLHTNPKKPKKKFNKKKSFKHKNKRKKNYRYHSFYIFLLVVLLLISGYSSSYVSSENSNEPDKIKIKVKIKDKIKELNYTDQMNHSVTDNNGFDKYYQFEYSPCNDSYQLMSRAYEESNMTYYNNSIGSYLCHLLRFNNSWYAIIKPNTLTTGSVRHELKKSADGITWECVFSWLDTAAFGLMRSFLSLDNYYGACLGFVNASSGYGTDTVYIYNLTQTSFLDYHVKESAGVSYDDMHCGSGSIIFYRYSSGHRIIRRTGATTWSNSVVLFSTNTGYDWNNGISWNGGIISGNFLYSGGLHAGMTGRIYEGYIKFTVYKISLTTDSYTEILYIRAKGVNDLNPVTYSSNNTANCIGNNTTQGFTWLTKEVNSLTLNENYNYTQVIISSGLSVWTERNLKWQNPYDSNYYNKTGYIRELHNYINSELFYINNSGLLKVYLMLYCQDSDKSHFDYNYITIIDVLEWEEVDNFSTQMIYSLQGQKRVMPGSFFEVENGWVWTLNHRYFCIMNETSYYVEAEAEEEDRGSESSTTMIVAPSSDGNSNYIIVGLAIVVLLLVMKIKRRR